MSDQNQNAERTESDRGQSAPSDPKPAATGGRITKDKTGNAVGTAPGSGEASVSPAPAEPVAASAAAPLAGIPEVRGITTARFLASIFSDMGDDSRVLRTQFDGPAKEAPHSVWYGQPTLPKNVKDIPAENTYYCPSEIGKTEWVSKKTGKPASGFRRWLNGFVALRCIVLDDIKAAVLAKLPPPTYVIETSADNYQVGYKLASPVTDKVLARTLHNAIHKLGYCDSNGNNPVRWVRLPVGRNVGKQFDHKLRIWVPDTTYTVDALVERLGLDLSETKADPKPKADRATAGATGASGSDSEAALTEQQVEDARTVLQQMRKVIVTKDYGTEVIGLHVEETPWHEIIGTLAIYGEQGFELLNEFSEGGNGYSEQVVRDKIAEKLDNGATAIGQLMVIAGRYGIENPAKGRRPSAASAFEDFAEERDAAEQARRDHQKKEDAEIGRGVEPIRITAEVLTPEEMVARFCFISEGSRVIDRKTLYTYSLVEFHQSFVASKTWIPDPTNAQPDRMKALQNTAIWFNNECKMQMQTVTWRPGYPEHTMSPEGKTALNTFRVRKLPEFIFSQLHVDRFLGHVKLLFGDRTEDFLNWFAHIEQFPGDLPHTAWLHVASHLGLGRNWLAGVAVRLWPGEVASNYDLANNLDGGFNGQLSHKRLIIVDEIRASGGAGHKLEQRLKSIITEEQRHINPKYGHQSVEYNCARWLLLSNHRSAIPMQENDRRYEVAITDTLPEDAWYYTDLYTSLGDQDFILSVLTYLRSRDISAFNPGARAKLTSAKRQAVRASGTDFKLTIADGLAAYEFPMVTGELIRAMAGMSEDEFAKGGSQLGHVMEDLGWIKIAKHRLPWDRGRKLATYIRASIFDTFDGRFVENYLPTQSAYNNFLAFSDFDG